MRDAGGDGGDESFPELVSRVVDDAKALCRAELAVLRAQTRVRLIAYRNAAILVSLAAMLGLAAVVAFAVGAVLVLATLVGPGFATLIVVLSLLVLAGLLGWFGLDQARVTRRLHRGEE